MARQATLQLRDKYFCLFPKKSVCPPIIKIFKTVSPDVESCPCPSLQKRWWQSKEETSQKKSRTSYSNGDKNHNCEETHFWGSSLRFFSFGGNGFFPFTGDRKTNFCASSFLVPFGRREKNTFLLLLLLSRHETRIEGGKIRCIRFCCTCLFAVSSPSVHLLLGNEETKTSSSKNFLGSGIRLLCFFFRRGKKINQSHFSRKDPFVRRYELLTPASNVSFFLFFTQRIFEKKLQGDFSKMHYSRRRLYRHRLYRQAAYTVTFLRNWIFSK